MKELFDCKDKNKKSYYYKKKVNNLLMFDKKCYLLKKPALPTKEVPVS